MSRDVVQVQKGELTLNVQRSSVKAYKRNGWTSVDDGNSETDSLETGTDHVEGSEASDENEEID